MTADGSAMTALAQDWLRPQIDSWLADHAGLNPGAGIPANLYTAPEHWEILELACRAFALMNEIAVRAAARPEILGIRATGTAAATWIARWHSVSEQAYAFDYAAPHSHEQLVAEMAARTRATTALADAAALIFRDATGKHRHAHVWQAAEGQVNDDGEQLFLCMHAGCTSQRWWD
jgi:hypothetical protein